MQEYSSVKQPLSDVVYICYGTVMFIVMTLGLFGNISTIVVLRQVEHRTKSISYLMINLATAGLIMCAFGYPVAVTYNLQHLKTALVSLRCSWLAFSNAVTGIGCILTLSLMSVSQYKKVTQITAPSNSGNRLNKMRIALILTAIWGSSVILCIPPMFGWNRFVPVRSGISCHPDWISQDPTDKAYIWFLFTGGFFIPLIVICTSYGLTYRFMQGLSTMQLGDANKRKRLEQQRKLFRMIIAAVVAFVLSWAPYGAVSLISTIKGKHVISPALSVVPELMAKASVMYNPIIYTSSNKAFRATLLRVFLGTFNRVIPSASLQGVEMASSVGTSVVINNELATGAEQQSTNPP